MTLVSAIGRQDRSLALLFGVSVYDRGEEGYSSLCPRVDNNIDALEELLTKYARFTEVKKFINPERVDIISTLETFRPNEPYVDTLLVYYCGHGDVGGGNYYLTGRDSFPSAKSSCLLFRDFEREFLRFPARKRILILDSCFSARAIDSTLADGGTAVIAANVERLTGANYENGLDNPQRGLFVFASSDRDQSSSTGLDDADHTAFSGLFITTLKTGITRVQREFLTLNEIAAQVQQMAKSGNLPIPSPLISLTLGLRTLPSTMVFVSTQALCRTPTRLMCKMPLNTMTKLAYSGAQGSRGQALQLGKP